LGVPSFKEKYTGAPLCMCKTRAIWGSSGAPSFTITLRTCFAAGYLAIRGAQNMGVEGVKCGGQCADRCAWSPGRRCAPPGACDGGCARERRLKASAALARGCHCWHNGGIEPSLSASTAPASSVNPWGSGIRLHLSYPRNQACSSRSTCRTRSSKGCREAQVRTVVSWKSEGRGYNV